MKPRVYQFEWFTKNGRPTSSRIVARTPENAVKKSLEVAKQNGISAGDQYCYIECSWLLSVLVLLIPGLHYIERDKWSKWETVK